MSAREGNPHPSCQPENATACHDLLGKLMSDIADHFPNAIYMDDQIYYKLYDAFEKDIKYTINMVLRNRKGKI